MSSIRDPDVAPNGLFITLYDKETLQLYLARRIYGTHLKPETSDIPTSRNHYRTLGDFACARKGTHVFFFLEREIIYGGKITGSSEIGAFYLNGPFSPMGLKANAPMVWDESKRSRYRHTTTPGQFIRPGLGRNIPISVVCQPYLIQFEDKQDLAGRAIRSDDLYNKVGEYSYPLPSISIANMSFCTITPGETQIALELFGNCNNRKYSCQTDEEIHLTGDPIPFDTTLDIQHASQAVDEAHLEAISLANPGILPVEIRPKSDEALCRQVPISPFKPYQMDRADICYYGEPQIMKGTIPNRIIELKKKKAGKNEIEQVQRYLQWLDKRLGNDAQAIKAYLFCPDYNLKINIHPNCQNRISIIKYGSPTKSE